jgi:hypothetical protein
MSDVASDDRGVADRKASIGVLSRRWFRMESDPTEDVLEIQALRERNLASARGNEGARTSVSPIDAALADALELGRPSETTEVAPQEDV